MKDMSVKTGKNTVFILMLKKIHTTPIILTRQIYTPRFLNIQATSTIGIVRTLGLRAAAAGIIYIRRKMTTHNNAILRRITKGKVSRKRGRIFRWRMSLLPWLHQINEHKLALIVLLDWQEIHLSNRCTYIN